MQVFKRCESIGNIAFYVGVMIHTLLMVIGYGDWNIPFHGRIMQLAFVLFCVKIITTNYSKMEWIVMLLAGGLGAVSYYVTRDEYVVSVMVMIFAAKNVDMRRVCRWIFYSALIATIITAILSFCGIGGQAVDIRNYGRGEEEARWCLGFGHANNLHGTVWYLLTIYVWLYFEKINWKHYAIMTIGNLLLFIFSVSRSGMLAAQMIIIAACILKYNPGIVKDIWIYLLALLELVGAVVLSIVCAVISPEITPIISTLDNMLTGRLHLIRWYADLSRWKLLASGGSAEIIDDGWAAIFMSYGYIIGIVFILFHLYLLYKIWTKKDGLLLIVFVTSVFYIFMEASYCMNSSYLLCNFSYIIAMILISKQNDEMLRKKIDLNY